MTKNEYFFIFQKEIENAIGIQRYIKNCVKIIQFFKKHWKEDIDCSPQELAEQALKKIKL